VRKKRFQKEERKIDKKFLLLTIVLTLIGLIALTSASSPFAMRSFGDRFFFLKQQAIWAGLGFLSLLIAAKIKYTFWE